MADLILNPAPGPWNWPGVLDGAKAPDWILSGTPVYVKEELQRTKLEEEPQRKELTMRLAPFEAVVLWHPNLRQQEAGESTRYVCSVNGLLAADVETARTLVGKRIPSEWSEVDGDHGKTGVIEETQLEVIVRPFRGL